MKNARWTKEKRMEFIDFRLHWDGRINRSDLINFFGISTPQASIDLSEYSKLAKKNLKYDKRLKSYLRGEKFQPVFKTSSPEHYLKELLSLNFEDKLPDESFVKWLPSNDVVPFPTRQVPSKILFLILSSIRKNCIIHVMYLSKAQEQPTSRDLSPHAIAHDGLRWHIRAFCHQNNQFRDFVIARFVDVMLSTKTGKAPSDDTRWNNSVELILSPNPDLPPAHQRVIELEYGMDEGQIAINCRQALLFYVRRKLDLAVSQEDNQKHQVVINNFEKIQDYID